MTSNIESIISNIDSTNNIDSIISNIDNTNNCSSNLDTIQTNFTAKIDSNKTEIDDKYTAIEDLISSTIREYRIDNNSNKCDGYIKVKEKLVEQNNFIDEQIEILNKIVGTTNIVGTTVTDEPGEIEQSIHNFNTAKAILLGNISTINNHCNVILNYIFDNYSDDKIPNSSSIRSKFKDLVEEIKAVSTNSSLENTIDYDKNRLQDKIDAIVTVNNFSAGSSPFSDLSSYKNTNTLTDKDDLMYEKVNNLCLGSNVNDSGACKQSNWGCKLSCQFLERKDGDGNQECSRLGSTANEIDYDVYENIYGETVKIHSHIHTHPGSHPHPNRESRLNANMLGGPLPPPPTSPIIVTTTQSNS